MDVIYHMIALDDFSGTAEELKEKYDNYLLEWKININTKELQNIQRGLDLSQATKGRV